MNEPIEAVGVPGTPLAVGWNWAIGVLLRNEPIEAVGVLTSRQGVFLSRSPSE
jgi:hypothetical protein